MKLRGRHILILDLIATLMAVIGAFVIRYEALWQVGPYLQHNLWFVVAVVVIRPVIYWRMHLYNRWWRYASTRDLLRIVLAVSLGTLVIVAVTWGVLAPKVNGVRTFSGSIILLEWLLSLIAIGGIRIVIKLWQLQLGTTYSRTHKAAPTRRVLVMGAGDAGAMVIREMQSNPAMGYQVVGLIDDDPDKCHETIYGVPVLGDRNDIRSLVGTEGIDEVVIAMPTAPGSAIRKVRDLCKEAHVAAKTIPGFYDVISGSVNISQLRDVQIEDLLRREPVRTNLQAVEGYVRNKVVLVTGAGGSIGSELCRQAAARHPKQILLLGHGENSIHAIWQELARTHRELTLTPLIVDIRDKDRLERLLVQHKPDVIFHAAAHKHVPLMELNVEEAFTTNVIGTSNLLRAAEKAGASRLVLISSDKAVNPCNIMGVTKHLAEVCVQHAAKRSGLHFGVVRFGNVLGSRGSVVPIFQRQIELGGPVTVTHPDMTRFFMTIPEAVQLVLQAAVMGDGGEIFVLDMGDQIRIVDMARDLISLSGLRPEEDIEIVYTGIRPGEKLYEELFGQDEEPVPTAHATIFTAKRGPIPSENDLKEGVEAILAATRSLDADEALRVLGELVPSFCPAHKLPVPETDRPASV